MKTKKIHIITGDNLKAGKQTTQLKIHIRPELTAIKRNNRANNIAQWIKALVAKPEFGSLMGTT